MEINTRMNENDIKRKKVEGWQRELDGLKRREAIYRKRYGEVPKEYVVDEEAFWKEKWEEDRLRTIRKQAVGLVCKKYKEYFGSEPRILKGKQEIYSQALIRGYREMNFHQDCFASQLGDKMFLRDKSEYEICEPNQTLPYFYIRAGKQDELVVAFHCGDKKDDYKKCVQFMSEIHKIYKCKRPSALMLASSKYVDPEYAKVYDYDGRFLVSLSHRSTSGVYSFVEYCKYRVFDNISMYSDEYLEGIHSEWLREMAEKDLQERLYENGTPENVERLTFAREYLDVALQEQSSDSM
jgi:hypothetical protein